MAAETCIPSNDYRVRLVLADGTAYRPVAECIEAGNEAAGSPGPFGPASEIRGFCWCAIHPSSTGCVHQSLALDAGGRGYERQLHCHLTGKSRDDGSGDGDDGGGDPPGPSSHPEHCTAGWCSFRTGAPQ